MADPEERTDGGISGDSRSTKSRRGRGTSGDDHIGLDFSGALTHPDPWVATGKRIRGWPIQRVHPGWDQQRSLDPPKARSSRATGGPRSSETHRDVPIHPIRGSPSGSGLGGWLIQGTHPPVRSAAGGLPAGTTFHPSQRTTAAYAPIHETHPPQSPSPTGPPKHAILEIAALGGDFGFSEDASDSIRLYKRRIACL